MIKAELITKISKATGLTKIETAAVVDAFIDSILEALLEGKDVVLRGFGSFKVKKRSARIARNPMTGSKVEVKEHFTPSFKFSNSFKKTIKEKTR